jgi:enoyl-[acyl-carrier protein] reductase I
MESTQRMLEHQTYLITGVADEHSLAMSVAKEIVAHGGTVICTGLGVTPFHTTLSERAQRYLTKTFHDCSAAVERELPGTRVEVLDVTLDESIEALARTLRDEQIRLNGFLHAIAMDRTIRNKVVKSLLDVTTDEFSDTMLVSAFSLVRLAHYLLKHDVLQPGASICALSYIAAEKITAHPYRNMSIAKAALERITIELADELGRRLGVRANAVRFSPYLGSKAGAATLTEVDVETSARMSPLGNARPQDLAREVVHLFRPDSRITGEIRHVDGGYRITG